jgi:DNA-binding Lrp family transcriptional regulator
MTLSNLKKYAHFTDTQAMDEATRNHIDAHSKALNKTDRAILESIRLHSVSQCATKLLVKTLADAVGKSTLTVRRSLSKLVRLNIIDRIATYRPINVGQGASILLIKPFISQNDTPEMTPREVVENPTVPTIEEVKKEGVSSSFITKGLKPSLHDTYASQPSLYNRFKSILSTTTGDTGLASKLFGVYKAQSIRMQRFEIHADKGELFEILAIQALQITTQATKRKKIKSVTGYYDGVLRELINKSLFADIFKEFSVEPDFKLCTH